VFSVIFTFGLRPRGVVFWSPNIIMRSSLSCDEDEESAETSKRSWGTVRGEAGRGRAKEGNFKASCGDVRVLLDAAGVLLDSGGVRWLSCGEAWLPLDVNGRLRAEGQFCGEGQAASVSGDSGSASACVFFIRGKAQAAVERSCAISSSRVATSDFQRSLLASPASPGIGLEIAAFKSISLDSDGEPMQGDILPREDPSALDVAIIAAARQG